GPAAPAPPGLRPATPPRRQSDEDRDRRRRRAAARRIGTSADRGGARGGRGRRRRHGADRRDLSPPARPRGDRRADAAELHRRGSPGGDADPPSGSGGGAPGALAVRRGALRLRSHRRLTARTGLRPQGPCRGRGGLPRRGRGRRLRRHLAGPRGGPADLRPLEETADPRGPHPPGAGGAGPDGSGALQPGDRRHPVRLRRQRGEAHLLPAHQAGPATRRRREPSGDGGAALPGVRGAMTYPARSAPQAAQPPHPGPAPQPPPSSPGPLFVPARRLDPSPAGDRRLRRLTTLVGAVIVLLVVLGLALASAATWLAGRGYGAVPATTGLGSPTALVLDLRVGDVRVLPSADVDELTLALVEPGETTLPAADEQVPARLSESRAGGRTELEVGQPSRTFDPPWSAGGREVLLLVPTDLELALEVR